MTDHRGPTRRDFLAGSLAALAAAQGRAWAGSAESGIERLTVLGKVAPRRSVDVAASPFSIGFETLDRKSFDPERTYEHVARLGAKWARVHSGWCRTEIERGKFEFGWLDAVVDRLLAIGLQPWLCVGFGNRLYTPAAPFESAVGWVPTGSEEGRAGWLRYVGALAAHFRGRVRHFEVWNEPNGASFWRPGKPNPAEYVELVRLTAPAIRQAHAEARVIGGAIAGMETKFFQACMEAGLGPLVDIISYHSYRFTPERNYEADVRQWRSLIARHRPGLALWHGEVGAASQPGGGGGHANHPWTEARQAKWMLRRFVYDLRVGTELISYFHTVDLVNYFTSDGPSGKTNFKGLLRGTDYTPKPVYFAYQCLCALFDRQTARADLSIEFQPPVGGAALPVADVVSAGFVRQGKAFWAYWLPPGPEMEQPDRQVDVVVESRAGAELVEPVLVDPLTATVYRLEAARHDGARWRFANLPLADHPLLVADRSAVLG